MMNEKHVHLSQDHTERLNLDLLGKMSAPLMIAALLSEEQKAGRVNGLSALQKSQERRKHLADNLQRIQKVYSQLSEAVNGLPPLPSVEQIQWAQTVLALPNLAFWEIDTTGLRQEDEIVRFTLLDRDGKVIDDVLMQPTMRKLSTEASYANGIKPEQLMEGLPPAQAWERIQAALTGRYVISFNQDWDVQKLVQMAERYSLPSVLVIGDCLQRHATQYYHHEYYLKLEDLCTRVGSPLPAKPNQTSIDRARGQCAVLHAFANAISDVRQLQSEKRTAGEASSQGSNTASDDFDPFLDENE